MRISREAIPVGIRFRLVTTRFTISTATETTISWAGTSTTMGTGVNDSVWVDLGLPVQTTKDGRTVKPLVAILCVDLDGRLNLNAHGNLSQTQAPTYTPAANSPGWGQGWGIADIHFLKLFQDNNAVVNAILEGRYKGLKDRFINKNDLPGLAIPSSAARRHSLNQLFGLPDSFDPTIINSAYGEYPDLYGSTTPLLDGRGQPVLQMTTNKDLFEQIEDWDTASDNHARLWNHPYQLRLGQTAPLGVSRLAIKPSSSDCPYSVGELEAILRPYDGDSIGLPSRLVEASTDLTDPLNPVLIGVKHRHEITTESWSVPVPTIPFIAKATGSVVPDFENNQGVVAQLLKRAEYKTLDINNNDILVEFKSRLAPELLAGLKMDLNRPFVNGVDDDGDGLIDNEGETENLKFYEEDSSGAIAEVVRNFDIDLDGTTEDGATASKFLPSNCIHSFGW